MIEIRNYDGNIVVGQYSQPYINPRPGAGVVRYNSETQCLEAYDGSTWVNLCSQTVVDLAPPVQEILRWAEKKRQEDQEIERLCAQYPNLAEVRREFEILRRLVQDVDHQPK